MLGTRYEAVPKFSKLRWVPLAPTPGWNKKWLKFNLRKFQYIAKTCLKKFIFWKTDVNGFILTYNFTTYDENRNAQFLTYNRDFWPLVTPCENSQAFRMRNSDYEKSICWRCALELTPKLSVGTCESQRG